MLDVFSPTIGHLPGAQGIEEAGMDADAFGVVKGADPVLEALEIDPGLSSDGRVDHGKQSGGDEPTCDTAQVGARHECGQVRNGSAAQCNDQALAVHPHALEAVPHGMSVFDGFDLFPVLPQPQELGSGGEVRSEKGQTELLGHGVRDHRDGSGPAFLHP